MEQPALIGRFFPVKVKDGYVMACVVSDKNLECLAAALNRPDLLEDPRFVRGPRTENFYLLAEEIERWSASLSARECEEALNRAGVPCSLYQQVDDLFAHPQVVERNSFASIFDDVLGDFLIQNMPFKLAGTDSAAASWAAKLGEHTNEILSECLHLKPAEIEKLRANSVVS
jgi:CoA:oxalate CoA-transferase